MSSGRRNTLLFAFAVSAAFLSFKAYTGGTPLIPSPAPMSAEVRRVMEKAGYTPVALTNELPVMLRAFRKADCEMLVGVMRTFGAEDRIVHEIIPDGWSLSFVFKGRTTADPPYNEALTSDYLNRMWWLFDGSVRFQPVLPVIHNGQCDLEAVPWSEMAPMPYVRRAARA